MIYLSKLRTFFKENPEDYFAIGGDVPMETFLGRVAKESEFNLKNGYSVELTKEQMKYIIDDLNGLLINKNVFVDTKYGRICLN